MSVASANDYDPASTRLKELGLWGFFLHPQIGWDNKVRSVRTIARRLDVAIESLAFIDDEPFELAQIRSLLPGVLTLPAGEYRSLPRRPEFNPPHITQESRRRRSMYVAAAARKRAAETARMNRIEFLRWTKTSITVRCASLGDVPRILELLNRTSQLNATGIVYNNREIAGFLQDRGYRCYVAELTDRFADYGTIGVSVCRVERTTWRLICFLLSCRVLNRGISSALLGWMHNAALRGGARTLEVCYVPRPRNRSMYVLLKFNGFSPTECNSTGVSVLTRSLRDEIRFPAWLAVNSEADDETLSNTAN
jgi:FkbH-like protein